MPYASIERRRQARRIWKQKPSHPSWIPDHAEGGDELWLVVACQECFAFFDVSRRGRRPLLCPDCR